MIVAQRTLKARNGHRPIDVTVRIYMPQPHSSGVDWECTYEIEWPRAVRRNHVGGADSVQALFLALQFVGAELYAGRPSDLSDLTWFEPGAGFGFPLPPSLRDLAVGEDKLL